MSRSRAPVAAVSEYFFTGSSTVTMKATLYFVIMTRVHPYIQKMNRS